MSLCDREPSSGESLSRDLQSVIVKLRSIEGKEGGLPLLSDNLSERSPISDK
jgi:hypothetical protein